MSLNKGNQVGDAFNLPWATCWILCITETYCAYSSKQCVRICKNDLYRILCPSIYCTKVSQLVQKVESLSSHRDFISDAPCPSRALLPSSANGTFLLQSTESLSILLILLWGASILCANLQGRPS